MYNVKQEVQDLKDIKSFHEQPGNSTFTVVYLHHPQESANGGLEVPNSYTVWVDLEKWHIARPGLTLYFAEISPEELKPLDNGRARVSYKQGTVRAIARRY